MEEKKPMVQFKDPAIEGMLKTLPPELAGLMGRMLEDIKRVGDCPKCGQHMRVVRTRCVSCGHEEVLK